MRHGFTMIELIATIVIIGIAFLSVPMAMQVNNKAIEFTQTSRGFYHGLAKMKIITNLPWDENNVADFQAKGYYQVLRTDQDSSTELNCSSVTLKRSGHYVGEETALYRRRCSNASASATLGPDGGDYDDLDDYIATSTTTIDSNFQIDNAVDYVSYDNSLPASVTFNPSDSATQTTSIKRVTVTVRETNPAQTISTYHYYATNVGTYQPVKKANFP